MYLFNYSLSFLFHFYIIFCFFFGFIVCLFVCFILSFFCLSLRLQTTGTEVHCPHNKQNVVPIFSWLVPIHNNNFLPLILVARYCTKLLIVYGWNILQLPSICTIHLVAFRQKYKSESWTYSKLASYIFHILSEYLKYRRLWSSACP